MQQQPHHEEKKGWRAAQLDKDGNSFPSDIDGRLRALQVEMNRVAGCSSTTANTSVLHGVLQRYYTKALREELDVALDRLLREQVSRNT